MQINAPISGAGQALAEVGRHIDVGLGRGGGDGAEGDEGPHGSDGSLAAVYTAA